MIFRFSRFLHAWGGITLALLMLVVSLSGAFLVWKPEYVKLVLPEARQSFEPGPENLALLARQVEAQFEANDIMSFYFPTEDFALARLAVYPDHYYYLDTTGNIVAQWRGNGRFEELIYDFHHRLLLEDTGLLIVGFGAMAMVILLIAGLIAWWPTRRVWRLGILPRSSERTQLLNSHRNLGIVLILPFLLALVTGIILVFPAESEALLLEKARSTQSYSDNMMLGVDDVHGEDSGDWLPALERAAAVFPDSRIRSASFPGTFNAYRVIGLQQPGEWNSLGMNKVYIDAAEGWMDIRIDNQNLPAIEQAYNTAYPLHTGTLGNFWYKCFLTLVGLGVTMLSVLGIFSFIRRYVRTP